MDDNQRLGLTNYTTGDAVTSLMYASAVNVILARSIGITESFHLWGIATTLFVFVDWLSRIGIPLGFPVEEDQRRRRTPFVILAKAFLEITAIYFLLAAIIMLCFGTPCFPGLQSSLDPRGAFATFLAFSFAWNLLMMYVMTKLRYRELVVASFFGCVFSLEGASVYTKGFKERFEKAESELAGGDIRAFDKLHLTLFGESLAKTCSQLLGHHIVWVNPIFAAVLFWRNDNLFLFSDYSGGWFGSLNMFRVVVLSALILLPTIFFFVSRNIHVRIKQESISVRICRILAALSASVLLIILYLTFDTHTIIFVMVVQHTFFGIFLQFATHARNRKENEPEETHNGVPK
jgi:hypothetical protein